MKDEIFDLDDPEFIKFHEDLFGIPVFDDRENRDLEKFLLTDPAAETFIMHSTEFKHPWGDMIPFNDERILAVKVNRLMKSLLQESWKQFQSMERSMFDTNSTINSVKDICCTSVQDGLLSLQNEYRQDVIEDALGYERSHCNRSSLIRPLVARLNRIKKTTEPPRQKIDRGRNGTRG